MPPAPVKDSFIPSSEVDAVTNRSVEIGVTVTDFCGDVEEQ